MQNTPPKPPHPSQVLEKISYKLRLHMAALLDPDNPRPSTDVMADQAALLDHAFRQLLASASRYESTHDYLAAFKAQNQYRYTADALKRLKDNETDSPGKNKT